MPKKVGDLRPSQFLTTFGPGAVMDLPEASVIVGGIDTWPVNLCERIGEPRLTKKLGVKYLLAPPVNTSDAALGTMRVYRFPHFHVCPKCNRLGRAGGSFEPDRKSGAVYCLHCRAETGTAPQAFPARFIVACARGHISDFPWDRYVHGGAGTCGGLELYLVDTAKTGSISDVMVECRACNKRRSLVHAFGKEAAKAIGACEGDRPWLGEGSGETCGETGKRYRALLRGASNAYFTVVESALAIPPYVEPVQHAVAAERHRLQKITSLAQLEGALALGVLEGFEGFAAGAIWQALQEDRNLGESANLDLLHPEWEQLMRGSYPGGSSEWHTEEQPVPDQFAGFLAKVVMVHRLVEVRALQAFTRIDPPADATLRMSGDKETQAVSSPAPLSLTKLDWLPGLQTRGEGLFLALSEAAIHKWEESDPVREAAKAMELALEQYCADRQIPDPLRPVFPGARYVLLHTLSHILMRQLCLHAGYSASSLRERIYARAAKGQEMAGLLIYTATPDSEGSLGGLVEQGRTDQFGSLLWQALEEAKLCSGDPLCAEHRPEAVGDQNGAACHACSLAAETSCERGNRFLDRSFLVGTVSRSDLSFFHPATWKTHHAG